MINEVGLAGDIPREGSGEPIWYIQKLNIVSHYHPVVVYLEASCLPMLQVQPIQISTKSFSLISHLVMALGLELWLIKNHEQISRLISGSEKNQVVYFLAQLKHSKIKHPFTEEAKPILYR
jgi:hypothetical protein